MIDHGVTVVYMYHAYLDYLNPSGHSRFRCWIIEIVPINKKWHKVMVIDNFPVVFTIATELMKLETLLYTKRQQVAAG